MEMLHYQKIFFPVCLLHFSLHLLLGSAYTRPDKYFINCGSSYSTSLTNGRVFVGDGKSSAGKGEPVKNSDSSKDIYQTARVYREPSSYKLKIYENGVYMVRLHFLAFNTSSANLSDAVFNVLASNSTKKGHFPASGFSLLTNFGIPNSTSSSPVVKEFLLTIPERIFRLHFIPSREKETSSLAFVNAIEVFLLPDNFISDNVTPAGDNSTYSGLLSQVLNKIHRINFGGSPIKQEYDRLWRNWEPDDPYLLNKTAAVNSKTYTRELNYKFLLGNVYIAPDLVYQNAKELNTDDNSNIVTWRFPVKKNAEHFIRAHFCDIVANTANVLWFHLYIYNFSPYINAGDKSAELASPFHFDFVVDSDDSGYLNISIARENDSVLQNAYLNGLEIMEVMKETVPIPMESESKKNHLSVTFGSVSVGAFLILIIVVVVVVLGFKFRKSDKDESVGSLLYGGNISFNNRLAERNSTSSLNLTLRIPFAEIKKATNNFNSKNSIGKGGFGKVYRGTLRGIKVAVKRSEPGHGQGLEEFQMEIIVLSQIRHRHLVSLIGYCDERSEMILVYEFMEKGTLREHLYDSSSDSNNSENSCSRSELSWNKRLEICIGAANGIEYLHTGPSGGIIHRDVKSTNILLDEDHVAKVADFGLSRLANIDPVSMDVKGSFGYLDPEYLTSLQLTEKSDVYSFGVVLLEVLCARPVNNNSLPEEEANLADWGMHWQQKGQLEEIIDPMLVGKIKPSSLRKFGETIEKCLKRNSAERPNMHDVLYDLQYALLLQETAMPKEPNGDNTTTATTTSLHLQLPVEWHLSSNSMQIDEDESTN